MHDRRTRLPGRAGRPVGVKDSENSDVDITIAREARDFAAAVLAALGIRGKTQDQLAQMIDRSPSTVSGWLSRNATRVPPMEVAFAIEDALGYRRGAFARYLGYADAGGPDWSWEEHITRGLAEAPLDDEDRELFLRLIRRGVETRQALRDTERDSS